MVSVVSERFQKYMVIIRKSIGWSADDLAKAINSKRQTINNLESNPPRTQLSHDRYIAIRSILSREMEKHPEETMILRVLLETCVDNYDKYTDEQRGKVIEKAKVVIPSIEDKEVLKKEINKTWLEIVSVALTFVGSILLAGTYDCFGWLKKK